MKRYIWQPAAFFIVGLGLYIYNGVTWNGWSEYMFHIIGYFVICMALAWALWKKESFKNNNK